MSKTLVAYFSATGTTARLAKTLAAATGADLYEITPAQKYSAADLDWTDHSSRASAEHNDLAARPAITGHVKDFASYDRVFVGFPVWWYREPRIIDTFMESEDFASKTVIPFATSGGSPIGDSGKYMQALAPKAKVLKGERLNSSASESELKKWAAQF